MSSFTLTFEYWQTDKLFVLIDEPQLKAAQNQLEDEIGPQLNTLLERAEKAIEVLNAKEQSLLSRVSLGGYFNEILDWLGTM